MTNSSISTVAILLISSQSARVGPSHAMVLSMFIKGVIAGVCGGGVNSVRRTGANSTRRRTLPSRSGPR